MFARARARGRGLDHSRSGDSPRRTVGAGRPNTAGYRTAPEVQALRPARWPPRACGRGRLEHLARPPRRLASPWPIAISSARDVAHHVMQEGVGGHLDARPSRPCARDAERAPAVRTGDLRLALGGPKGAEVVLADRGRRPPPACASASSAAVHHRRARRATSAERGAAIEDQVAIGARARAVARMKMRRHRRDPAQADVARQMRCWRRAPSRARCAPRRCRSARPARARARRRRCGRRTVSSTGASAMRPQRLLRSPAGRSGAAGCVCQPA